MIVDIELKTRTTTKKLGEEENEIEIEYEMLTTTSFMTCAEMTFALVRVLRLRLSIGKLPFLVACKS